MTGLAPVPLPVQYNDLSSQERRLVRERYVRKQSGLCSGCDEPLDGPPHISVANAHIDWSLFPKNFQDHPVHLHHDHTTGLTIGAVHARCNAFLWQYFGE
tara:strand:- start:20824 stop:21123 length:300 start_codon:yes stop_codon:yes gene_type:complete